MKWIAGVVIWVLVWEVYSYVGGEEKIVVLAGWLLVALLISTACIIGCLVRIIDLLEKNSDNERAAQERPTIAKETFKISMPTVKAVGNPLPPGSPYPPPGSPYEPDPYATMQGNAPPGAPAPAPTPIWVGMPPSMSPSMSPNPVFKQTIKISMPDSGGGAALPQATQDERDADNERAAKERPAPAPAPAPGAPGPKKATVYIGMPPKSDSKQTIKISRPSSGGGAALPQATRDERDADNERGMKEPPKLPRAVDARWDARPARPMAVGTYEYRDDKGTITTSVLLANGVCEAYTNGKKDGGDIKWKIANGELRIFDETGFIGVSVINKDNSFSVIALIEDGERTDFPKEIQPTYKKIK